MAGLSRLLLCSFTTMLGSRRLVASAYTLRPHLSAVGARHTQVLMSTGAEQREVPVTPDFNTPVEVDKLRLSTPKAPPARAAEPAAKWAGLDGLDERTTGSLVPDTLKQMGEDEEFQATAARLRALGAARMTLEEKKLRRRALDELGLPSFQQYLARAGLAVPRATSTILQLNIGLYCNQACAHCHVESSPRRTESMSREVAERCLVVLRASGGVATLDITGGAPELNPQFRYLVEQASALGVEIIDRCNLTVLQEPGQEDLAEFLAKHKVRVVASLPCYSPKNVNTQRGSGVFDRSILGLRQLNALGYGVEGSGLSLDLVYNPLGAFLPPPQEALEAKYKLHELGNAVEGSGLSLNLVYNPLGAFLSPPQEALEAKYKEELMEAFGITFNSLFTITNMPIKRFADFLYRRGELKDYMELLVRNFNPAATKGLMCKDTVSVGWDGRIFDCDFNQQLGLGMGTAGTNEDAPFDLKTMGDVGYSIFDVDSLDELASTKIVLESHCFGCTSGMGSSCQGATS